MIRVVDRMIADASIRSGVAASAAVTDSWNLGLEFGAAGVPKGFLYDISDELLRSIVSVTKDSANDIWNEAGRAIKTVVRRSALGVDNLTDSIRMLSRSLRDPKTFGTVETRAEAIIRTEVNRTFAMAGDAQMESAAGAMKGGGFLLMKYWLTAEDSRTRPAHEVAGETYDIAHPIPQDEPFIVGGESMLYPLDPTASPGNTINCFVAGTLIGGRVLAVLKANYAGATRRIETQRGRRLTVTPNHPVLTNHGWVAADQIREGDYLLADTFDPGNGFPASSLDVDHEHPEATVDQVFESLSSNGGCRTVVGRGLDLHGDARGLCDSNIDVVAVNGEVLDRIEAAFSERSQDLGLEKDSGVMGLPLSDPGPEFHLDSVSLSADHGGVGRGNLPGSLGFRHALPLQPLLLGLASRLDAVLPEDPVDRESARASGSGDEAVSFREAKHRLAGLVSPDQVVSVSVEFYSGPVFDVQTALGWVHSNGIIAHNCRCVSVPVVRET